VHNHAEQGHIGAHDMADYAQTLGYWK